MGTLRLAVRHIRLPNVTSSTIHQGSGLFLLLRSRTNGHHSLRHRIFCWTPFRRTCSRGRATLLLVLTNLSTRFSRIAGGLRRRGDYTESRSSSDRGPRFHWKIHSSGSVLRPPLPHHTGAWDLGDHDLLLIHRLQVHRHLQRHYRWPVCSSGKIQHRLLSSHLHTELLLSCRCPQPSDVWGRP